MAIRDKLRAKFGKAKSPSTSGDASPISVVNGEEYYTGRKDVEYYKPHEIPKSKYARGRIDPEHKEQLESYSFGDAFAAVRRRTSIALSGTFSPGGTKALSAAPSAAVSRRPSVVGLSKSRASSIGGSGASPTYDSASVSSGRISEGSDEDADASTGELIGTWVTTPDADHSGVDLSRIGTVREHDVDADIDRQITVTEKSANRKRVNSNDIPFTVEELERAMTRATMRTSIVRMGREPIAVA